MHTSTFFTGLALATTALAGYILDADLSVDVTTASSGYVLEDDYMSADFFDQFSFWDSSDPTNGFVAYQSRSSAQSMGLISGSSGNITMGVDSTNITPNGRPSVRLTSNKSYNYGLIVVDLEHMPGGICGTWPAFWMLGPDWPNQGEIDIIEGVNEQMANLQTLHTGPGCSIANEGGFSGALTYTNCTSSGGDNTGCQIAASSSYSYGSGFNANGGGVYATEWTSSSINVWFFPRGSIPSDALGSSPNPSNWGTPVAKFQGACDISTSFQNQQIVFDTTFCGDWAGDDWSESSCSAKASTCDSYVENNPSAFADAYWSINALKVYQQGAAATTPASTTYATSTSVQYVTQPTSVATTAPATTAPATTFYTGYIPFVGPSGVIDDVDHATTTGSTSTSYATAVASGDTLGAGNEAAPSQSEGDWETEDGVMVYVGEQKRHAKHMERHKRHGKGL